MSVKHTFRIADNKLLTKNLTGMSAIKMKCQECTGWQGHNEIKFCSANDCALWPFRFGRAIRKTDPDCGEFDLTADEAGVMKKK